MRVSCCHAGARGSMDSWGMGGTAPGTRPGSLWRCWAGTALWRSMQAQHTVCAVMLVGFCKQGWWQPGWSVRCGCSASSKACGADRVTPCSPSSRLRPARTRPVCVLWTMAARCGAGAPDRPASWAMAAATLKISTRSGPPGAATARTCPTHPRRWWATTAARL